MGPSKVRVGIGTGTGTSAAVAGVDCCGNEWIVGIPPYRTRIHDT